MLSKAVETAVKMETDAIRHYREAAGKTKHPIGRRTFESLVAEEQRHLKMLKDILAGLDIEPVLSHPAPSTKTVFSDLDRQEAESVTATTDDMQALGIALDFEKKGYHFYLQSAAEATDMKEKALLARLAEEEKRHFALLLEMERYVTTTGEWFIAEEQKLLDEL